MPKLHPLILATALALAAAPALAVYKCKDSKGKTYYTQTPPIECVGKELEE